MSLALAEKRLVGRLIGPYQREGVEWMLGRETHQGIKGGFLCDEMGLGKTVEVIATMLGNQKRRTLIIAPKSVLTQWRDEVRKFTGRTLRVGVWDGPNRTRETIALAEMDIVITSYSLLLPRNDEKNTPLHRIPWDRLVLDEGHEVRNPKTKTFMSIRTLKTNIRWIVSGTPIFNSIRDFASLCSILGISQKQVQAQCEQIRHTYVLRRTKQDVSEFNMRLALPPCEFDNLELEMNPEEKQLYTEVYSDSKEKVKALLRTNDKGTTMHILECLLRVRQAMIWPQLYYDGMAVKDDQDPLVFEGRSKKHDTLIELIKMHPKEKSLVFCQFVGEMDQIQLRLASEKIDVYRIDGSVSKDAREHRIESYKKSKSGAVFIIQIKAGGVGLNLQEATRVYIMSPAWNPATELQAIARSHRTGQLNKVYIKKLVYAGSEELPSIEESIMKLQDTKALVCAEVLNDPRLSSQLPKTKSKYTIQDLKRLFV
jgi:SNF2 family DNA or RNA helicase